MELKTEITRIEGRVKAAGSTMTEMFRSAGINSAQWHRWKTGKSTPMLTSWERINAAADRIAPADHPQMHGEGT